jgi:hypothetical protein
MTEWYFHFNAAGFVKTKQDAAFGKPGRAPLFPTPEKAPENIHRIGSIIPIITI